MNPQQQKKMNMDLLTRDKERALALLRKLLESNDPRRITITPSRVPAQRSS